ncbi:MAG: phosphate/phosphite/phosphonate ABC transporter substrate-binding protein [Acidobacteria bacterium]|nr:phosphate/phosphite/phosphonate ABC transporter substrate-binding protein [Acidobacteriota bacterium]
MRWRRTASVVLGALALSCGGSEPPPPGPHGTALPSPAEPARPPAKERLQIGVLPERNIFRQLERFEPLAAYLSARIGQKVQLKILPRYGNIVANFESAGLDGAFLGSFTYVLAHRRLDVDVIARPVMQNGRSTYFGVVLTRRDSGIRDAQGLRGKRFAFVDQATTAGYLLPLDFLAQNGVKDYRTFFGETYFAGTHEDVIRDVLDGRADAGAAKSSVLERMAGEDPRVISELTFLARSPDVPENGLALRRDLDPELKARLQQALLTMHEDAEGRLALEHLGAARFIETRDEDYEPVYRFAREVGIDLDRYTYDSSR